MISWLDDTPQSNHSRAVTIGCFDGMHKGHQALLDQMILLAMPGQLRSCVVLFDPSPKVFFGVVQQQIMPIEQRIIYLKDIGIDDVFVLRTTKQLLNMHADTFVRLIMLDQLNTAHWILGHDATFGHQRLGCHAWLCKQHYPIVYHHQSAIMAHNKIASSSALRQAIKENDKHAFDAIMGRKQSLFEETRIQDKATIDA